MRVAMVVVLVGCGAAAPNVAADEVELDGAEDATDELPAITGSDTASPRAALLAEARRELGVMTASHYVHHTRIDEATGLFDYDCSGFVGYALARSAPAAWAPIAATRKRPLAKHFEAFFAAPEPPWTRVDDPMAIVPGDVIAWLEPPETGSKNTGHVVIVAGPPRAAERANELVVPVIDSSHSGHGKADVRVRDHRNGLGTGELVLHVDNAHRIVGYRWSTWKGSRLYDTTITVGHLP